MVTGYILLPVSLGQLAVDLVLVGYECCQRLVGLVLILFLLLVFFLGLSLSILRLWFVVLVFRGGLWWRAGRWRSAPFVLLLFWGGGGVVWVMKMSASSSVSSSRFSTSLRFFAAAFPVPGRRFLVFVLRAW